MTGKRKRRPAAFKARVALEAARQAKTIARSAAVSPLDHLVSSVAFVSSLRLGGGSHGF